MKHKFIKIIFIGNFPFGGPSANLLRNFSLSLTEIKTNNIEILLPTGRYYGKTKDKDYKRKGNFEKVNYKHMCFKNHPRNYLGKIVDILYGIISTLIYLIISRIKRKNDITILYNTDYLIYFLILRILLNNKLILILPEFFEKPTSNKYSLITIKWKIFNFNMKYLIRYADGFFVASHYLKDYIKNSLRCEKNIYVLPNVTDPSFFEKRNIYPFIEGKITIGYTGTPTRKDGVIDLIKSFALLNKKYPNTHLLIIGDITNGESIIPQLEEIAIKEKIEANVTFTGLVLFNQIPDLLNSCQVLALTRPNGIFAEAGFPTKLGEYFACKKPVLITKIGDIPLYFKNKEHLIIAEPENIYNIAEGFEIILNNPILCDKMTDNSYNWMNENLNYRNISLKLNNFINSI